jgi:hypothetical protein
MHRWNVYANKNTIISAIIGVFNRDYGTVRFNFEERIEMKQIKNNYSG